MARLLAVACLACAAFAWVPPGIDRVGLAALGLAFLAWSVGKPLAFNLALMPKQPAAPAIFNPDRIEPIRRQVADELRDELDAERVADLAAYSLTRGGEGQATTP